MAVSCSSTRLRASALPALPALPALAALMFGACSAPPGVGDDDDGPQLEAYGGSNRPGSANPNGASNGSGSNGAAPSGTGASTAEGNPNGVQLGNNSGAGQVGAANSTPGAVGAPGAMAGSAGAGNAGAGNAGMGNAGMGNAGAGGMLPQQPSNPPSGAAGSTNMPPQQPQQPGQQQPQQPQEPPFVGPGCDGNAFFCEDFEGFNVGAVQANADFTPTGNVTIDSAVARGNRSLHIQTQGNGRSVISLAGFAPPNNSFFARMYVQATAFPTAPDYAHFTLVEATGAGAGMIRPIGGQYIPGMGTLWGAGSDGGPTGDWTNWRPTAPVEAGRFLCIEWEMNSADNNINVWIDSVPKTELSVSTTSHGGSGVDFVFPRFNNLTIGWQLYQGGSTPNQFSLWYDDIVLSTRRVGCVQ
jgi:hypothetical protein